MEKRDVFISYHTSSAKHIVEEISEVFEKNKVSCWYAPRDCEDNFDEAIISAIGKAKIFLLIINVYSSNSEQVKNEIKKAFDRYIKKEMGLIIFQVDKEPVSSTVEYFLGRMHRMDGTIPPLNDRLEELLARAQSILLNANNIKEFSEESKFTSTFVKPTITFVGREKEVKEISNLLEESNILFVCGIGGIGKSEIVKKYIVENQSKFRSVIWTTYNKSLKDLILFDFKIAGFIRLNDETDEEHFNKKLDFISNNITEEDLIVIDNFNNLNDEDLESILNLKCKIIFTTRTYDTYSQYNKIHLKEMSDKEDLLKLFNKIYQRNIKPTDIKTMYEIFDIVNGHTLSIILIANLMKKQRITPELMLKRLQEDAIYELDNIVDTQSKTNHIISSIFNMVDISKEELMILKNLTLVPIDGIEAMHYQELSNIDDYEDIDSLIYKNLIMYDNANDILAIHPIVCRILMKNEKYNNEENIIFIKSIIEKLKNIEYLEYSEKSWYLKTAQRIHNALCSDSILLDEFSSALGMAYKGMSRHLSAIKILEEYVRKTNSIEAKFKYSIIIGDSYRCLCRYDDLLYWINEANSLLDYVDKTDFEVKKDIASLYGRYAFYYSNTKQIDKAIESATNEIEEYTAIYGKYDVTTAWAYFDLANVYDKGHLYDKSIELYKESEDIFTNIGFSNGIANCISLSAAAKVRKGDYDSAILDSRRALELFYNIYEELHIDIAFAKTTQYFAFLGLNKELEANSLKEEALDILNKLNYPNSFYEWEKYFLDI